MIIKPRSYTSFGNYLNYKQIIEIRTIILLEILDIFQTIRSLHCSIGYMISFTVLSSQVHFYCYLMLSLHPPIKTPRKHPVHPQGGIVFFCWSTLLFRPGNTLKPPRKHPPTTQDPPRDRPLTSQETL